MSWKINGGFLLLFFTVLVCCEFSHAHLDLFFFVIKEFSLFISSKQKRELEEVRTPASLRKILKKVMFLKFYGLKC